MVFIIYIIYKIKVIQNPTSRQLFPKLNLDITNLKDKVINLNDIIIKNLQVQNKLLKTKVNILGNEIIDLEIQNNNVDQHSRRNNVEISGIPQSASDNQLKEKVFD